MVESSVMLQGYLAQVQVDLQASQRETERLEHQLTCLIQLVRKAWLGDASAASDVAKIVGVAPPEYSVERQSDNVMSVTAKPKGRALQNWVALTVGLLNLDFKRQQVCRHKQQQGYLLDRNDFLNNQILDHGEMMGQQQYQQQMSRPTSSKSLISQEVDKQVAGSQRPPTGKKRVKHLYRGADRADSSITWGDLFVKGFQKSDLQNDERKAPPSRMQQHHQAAGDAEPVLSYDHPARYSKLDLFELDAVLADNSRRPPHPRLNSAERSKSSVTRTQSAARRPAPKPQSEAPQRPRTAHISQQRPVYANCDLLVTSASDMNRAGSSASDLNRAGSSASRQGAQRTRSLSEQYRRDLEDHSQLEREFRKTASQLQKKLGITLGGMV